MIEALEDEGNGPAVQELIWELDKHADTINFASAIMPPGMEDPTQDVIEAAGVGAGIVAEAIFGLKKPEIDLAIQYPLEAVKGYTLRSVAAFIGSYVFGRAVNEIPDGTKDNACYHALWSALMAREIGEEKAELFGTAHEPNDDKALNSSTEDGYRVWHHVQMDLHNNAVGRAIAGDIPEDESEIQNELLEYFGSEKAVKEASRRYLTKGADLLTVVRVIQAWNEAIPCKLDNDGNWLTMDGTPLSEDDIKNKLVFIIEE